MPKEGHVGAQLVSAGLTLKFVWRGDRFEHAITRDDESLATATAPGLETPVYQEVHQQGELVFASGMSGDRHWSASVEPCEGGLLFDIACRCKSDPGRLGSAYADWDKSRLQVVGRPTNADSPPRLTTEGSIFLVEPTGTFDAFPCTVRYRFAVLKPQAHWVAENT